jgi:hypothetical protein
VIGRKDGRAGKAGTTSKRHRKRRLSHEPLARLVIGRKDGRAGKAGTTSKRHRKRRLSHEPLARLNADVNRVRGWAVFQKVTQE